MSSTGEGLSISGLEDCLRWIDKLPENCIKATQTALRDASKNVCKSLRQLTPRRFRKLVRYKVWKQPDGKLNAGFGLWNGHQQQGHQSPNADKQIDDWFKAYWKNYGTLTHRDPNHHFIKPVNHPGTAAAQRRRNRVGQPAEHFFEASIAGYEDKFIQAFKDSLDRQETTFYER